MTSDLWLLVTQFAERPPELQALAAVDRQVAALVRSRRCWGRALRPLFDFPDVCCAKALRMACDWTVLRLLPERYVDADRLLVAGSFALHEAMVRRGLSPAWYPNDIDVWLVNGSEGFALAEEVADKMRALGLTVDVSPGVGEYVTHHRFVKGLNNQDVEDGLEPGSCVVRRVTDLRYSFEGLQLGKLSLIGTRPAGGRGWHWNSPRLTPRKVLECFDIDVCRVGLLLPEGGPPVFDDQKAFDAALRDMSAKQGPTRENRYARGGAPSAWRTDSAEQATLRGSQRRRKYEARGFKFR
jgi:hypothetical protein